MTRCTWRYHIWRGWWGLTVRGSWVWGMWAIWDPTACGRGGLWVGIACETRTIHPVFHVSMLKKCLRDPTLILHVEGLGVDENLSYEELLVEILDRHVKRLRNKEIPTMKVLWRNHLFEGPIGRPRPIWDSSTPIFSALEVRLPTLKSKFPYLSIFCCYCLAVHSKYVMIWLALR